MCTNMSYFQAHVDDRDYYGNKRLELAGQVCSTVRKTIRFRMQISLLLSILLFICAKMINLLRETREVCQSSLLSIYSQKHVSYKLLIHLNNDLVFVFSQLLSLLFEDLFKRFNAEVSDKVYFLLLRCIFLQISLPASCGT